ncbi:Dimethylaniline monooxygenase [N-oxide-forming] 1 [Microtus ochrogaster]|uniref:Flavin-containing monooxygenase n=1 Tax=Microtus ochrogaster TaxID=79684 RepID=A0A8J6KQL7_MICOH|nr:Dimethylaniline monooxygenase [N-oxide-forming] 1 [Microtus ochrogaster]
MAKRVAIVGAGVSGLASIKCCLEEGLEPTCFERSDDLGGLWRFTTKVCSVTKCPDFATSGQWEVVTLHEGKQSSAIFDAVMVCTGFLTNPHLPLDSFPGLKNFKGQYFHSRQYKHPDIFKDKRVLVVGMGNSGTDIAVEASHLAKKVFLSTTGGAWVISRVFDSGYPWDMIFMTRFQNMFRNFLPTPIVSWLISKKMNSWFNHVNYGVAPEDRTQLREPVLNDELPGRIITGKVLVKSSIKEVKENSVIFNNTPKEEPIDIIVFATGYTFAFPFLDESVVKVEDGQASLYKYILPAHLPKPTLAVIGLIKPLGSMIPTGETQARWVVQVLKGATTVPPPSVMMAEVNERKKNKHSGDFPYQEDYPNFMDHKKFWEYLREFAEHFDLLKYIQFKTTVRSVTQRPDFSETGQWDVVTETEGKQHNTVFDAIMVCTGHFMSPRLPLESFPGIHKFKGQILHSQEYKIPDAFQDKRIVVVGLGNSGADIAVELSRIAAQKLMAEATKKEQLIKRGVIKDTSEDKINIISYLDEIAQCIGSKPNIPLLFLTDPRLAWEETSKDGMTRVYRSLVTNVCKEMSSYSDFPYQEDYPNFMDHKKFWEYLREFAEHFDLLKYIQFKTTVRSVTQRPDFSETGQWDVVTETDGKQHSAVFDGVMVCTGQFLSPRLPLESFPGIHKFKGQILHSQEYKIPDAFQDKRIVVVGLGNSGADIAVELSRIAAQVHYF